jgi:hypothetical protein
MFLGEFLGAVNAEYCRLLDINVSPLMPVFRLPFAKECRSHLLHWSTGNSLFDDSSVLKACWFMATVKIPGIYWKRSLKTVIVCLEGLLHSWVSFIESSTCLCLICGRSRYISRSAIPFECVQCLLFDCTIHAWFGTIWSGFVIVPDHDGGRPEEVNSCVLNSYMVYL